MNNLSNTRVKDLFNMDDHYERLNFLSNLSDVELYDLLYDAIYGEDLKYDLNLVHQDTLCESYLDRLYIENLDDKLFLKKLVHHVKRHLMNASLIVETQLLDMQAKVFNSINLKIFKLIPLTLDVEFLGTLSKTDLNSKNVFMYKNIKSNINNNNYTFASEPIYVNLPDVRNCILPDVDKKFHSYKISMTKSDYNRFDVLNAYLNNPFKEINKIYFKASADQQDILLFKELVFSFNNELKSAYICQLIFDLYSEKNYIRNLIEASHTKNRFQAFNEFIKIKKPN